jgi:hypothetical protein
MKNKPVLCPQRLRHVPRQFSWIDQRLVRERHIQGRSPEALALYLFLCTVADAQGASYYSDASAGRLLTFAPEQLRSARAELMAAGLITWRAPFYQVLSLDHLESGPGPAAAPMRAAAPQPDGLRPAAAPAARPLEVPAPRSPGGTRSIGDILRAMMQEPREEQAP